MVNDHDRKLNDLARETGKTHAELLTEARDALLGEPTGLRKWVELVKSSLRRSTATDRENRRIFKENEARSHAEMARAMKTAEVEMGDRPTEAGSSRER
jgi:hypothetical protein